MIHHTIPTVQTLSWQDELSQLISTPEALFEALQLDPQYLEEAKTAHALFPVRCTRSFLSRMKPGDVDDPLLKQVLPLGIEAEDSPGFVADPLQESSFNATPGLVHKYRSRALLIASGQCAINCRYCFRRSFDYSANRLDKKALASALSYIAEDSNIDEVILSGGDPLSLPDHSLRWILQELENIEHLRRIRIHSRLPIVLPKRISQSFVGLFQSTRLQKVMVLHCNHIQELDSEVAEALKSCRDAGFQLLNQAVLLRGINDSLGAQLELHEGLFEHEVLPYYLHLLDRVQGSAHFEVEETEALMLMREVRAHLPGYLVPRLAREEAGKSAKTVVF